MTFGKKSKFYGIKRSLSLLLPYSDYGESLTNKKYGVIEFTENIATEMVLQDEIEDELALRILRASPIWGQ